MESVALKKIDFLYKEASKINITFGNLGLSNFPRQDDKKQHMKTEPPFAGAQFFIET